MIKYTNEKSLTVKKHVISQPQSRKFQKKARQETIATIKRIAKNVASQVDCTAIEVCLEALPGFALGNVLTNVAGNIEWAAGGGAPINAILVEGGPSLKISSMLFGAPADIINSTMTYISGGNNFRNNFVTEILPVIGIYSIDNTISVDSGAPNITGYRYQTRALAEAYIQTQVPSIVNKFATEVGGTNTESFTLNNYSFLVGQGVSTILAGAVNMGVSIPADPFANRIEGCQIDNLVGGIGDETTLKNCLVTGCTMTGGRPLMFNSQITGGDFTNTTNMVVIGGEILGGIYGPGNVILTTNVFGGDFNGSFLAGGMVQPDLLGVGGQIYGTKLILPTAMTGDWQFVGGALSFPGNIINVGQTINTSNTFFNSACLVDGTLTTVGCMGQYPTMGLGTRVNIGDFYDNRASGLTSIDVQGAIDELATSVLPIANTSTISAPTILGAIRPYQKNSYTDNEYPTVVVSEVNNTLFRLNKYVFPGLIAIDDGIDVATVAGVTFPNPGGIINPGESVIVTFVVSGLGLAAYTGPSTAGTVIPSPATSAGDFEIDKKILTNTSGVPFVIGVDNLYLLQDFSLKKSAFDMPLAQEIDYTNLISDLGNTIAIPGQLDRVQDRFEYTVMTETQGQMSPEGYMTIPALTTPTNLNAEQIGIKYNIATDSFGNLWDMNGNSIGNLNQTNFSLPFASLVGVLTQLEFGNPDFYNNRYSTNTNIVTTTAGGIITDNQFDGQVNITSANTKAVVYNIVEPTGILNVLDGQSYGSHVGVASTISVGTGNVQSRALNGGSISVGSGSSDLDFVIGGSIVVTSGSTSLCEVHGLSQISAGAGQIVRSSVRGATLLLKSAGTGVLSNIYIFGDGLFEHQSDIASDGLHIRGDNSILVGPTATLDKSTLWSVSLTLNDNASVSQHATIEKCVFTASDDVIVQGGQFRYINGFNLTGTTTLVGCIMSENNLSGTFNIANETHVYKRIESGFSNFETTIDLDTFVGYVGTALDLASVRMYGQIIFTGTGPAYTIDVINNMNINHPVRFKPDSNITALTIVHGTGVQEPRCEGGINTVLNGVNGDNATYEYINERGETFEINHNSY